MATPAGILGFSSLLVPDQYQEGDKPKFKARLHLTPASIDRLESLVLENCMGLFEKLCEDMEGQKAPPKVDLHGWLQDKFKEPREGDRVQLPVIQIARDAHYKNKKGEEVQARVKAWDKNNQLLDLKTLRLGMGSTVQIIVTPGLFCSAFSKMKAAPSLRLEGIRVLKLEQYGAGGPQVGDLTEEDLAGLEADFEPDNLSQYVLTEQKPTAASEKVLDESEIPF